PVAHQPEQVDVEAVLDRWGAIGTAYPTTDRPEIEEYRQTTIRALLRFGDDQGYCSGLEDCIRAIGLGDYLPPQEKTTAVTIPADMSPLEITMPLNRTGEIRRADYLRTVARALTRALTARSDFTTPSEVTD
ncbi:MAG: hypothetical protein J2P17_00005, partial [Mycobacterium sp.]|nr:hypothetical protein [Mycobacterium sp.]